MDSSDVDERQASAEAGYYHKIFREELNKRSNGDIFELNCKECETPTECEEGVSSITCGYCCATMGICMEEE